MSKDKKKQIEGLIEKGKQQKHLSYEEINEVLPDDIYATAEIEVIFNQLDELHIPIEEEEEDGILLHEEEMEEERAALEEVRNPLRSYLKEAGETSLLTHEQEVTIASGIEEVKKRLQDTKDSPKYNSRRIASVEKRLDGLKAQLIQANLRLVINIAKKYSNPKLTLRDLIQEGNIGLMKAVEKFRFREGYKFSTYATWWIRQAITRAIADCSSTIRIPVHMREKSNKVNKTSRSLMHELGREPTAEELAKRLQIPPDKVRMIIKSMQREPISLETPVGDD
ncbi:MAG: RNA polymerase sigma factor RpoD, partial [bacterium (Candidatus Ratteibacteria) CG23_combo_of_CG06-09_8_20_14_all_48_7]